MVGIKADRFIIAPFCSLPAGCSVPGAFFSWVVFFRIPLLRNSTRGYLFFPRSGEIKKSLFQTVNFSQGTIHHIIVAMGGE